MALPSGIGDREPAVGPHLAKPHSGQPALTWIVHQAGRAPCRTTQMQPVQRRSAACLQVRLIPHGSKIRQIPAKSKPVIRRGLVR